MTGSTRWITDPACRLTVRALPCTQRRRCITRPARPSILRASTVIGTARPITLRARAMRRPTGR
jgi:hypothetical protein